VSAAWGVWQKTHSSSVPAVTLFEPVPVGLRLCFVLAMPACAGIAINSATDATDATAANSFFILGLQSLLARVIVISAAAKTW
jgi:hypothetical protein